MAELKHHTREIYTQIVMFFEDYWIEKPANPFAQFPLSAARIFDAWVRALPDLEDTDAWKWIDWDAFQYQSGCLKSVMRYFEDLFAKHEQGADDENLKSLLPRAQNIYRDMNVVLDCVAHCDRTFNTPQDAGELLAKIDTRLSNEIEHLPAQTILVLLWPHVYPEYLDLSLDLNKFDMRHWPSVPYHPFQTAMALYDAVIEVVNGRLAILTRAGLDNRETDLLVTPRRTEAYFEICITHPTITMTPASWERYQTSLQHRNSLEHLRELGGSVEPLTWDEGHGQGVIVRLPWATP